MNRNLIFGPALVALAVGGCQPKADGTATPSPSPSPAASPFKSVYHLQDCPGGTPEHNLGVININVDAFDGKGAKREVNYLVQADYNPLENKNGMGNAPGNPYKKNKPKNGKDAPAYDVYMQQNDFTPVGENKYVVVRILIDASSKWDFYVDTDPATPENKRFQGIAMEGGTWENVACGNYAPAPPNGSANGIKKIAYFYLDYSALMALPENTVVPFVIGLQSEKSASAPQAAAVPVLIDPKMINDGGGWPAIISNL